MLTINEIMSYEFKNETEMAVFLDLMKLPQPIFCMLLEELISGNMSYELFTTSKLRMIVSSQQSLEKSINVQIYQYERL